VLSKFLIKIFFLRSKLTRNPFEKNKIYLKYFKKFNSLLESSSGTTLEVHYKLRFHEICKIIKKYRIKKVLEMGTGRTTFVFNIIPNIKCLSIEQDEKWLKNLNRIFKLCNINFKVHLSKFLLIKKGGKFKILPNFKPDMLYIDGPYLPSKKKRKFNTFTGKPAYYDFETLFLRNHFPKVIMIEGRTDTADAILKSKHASKYRFYGEFIYSIQRGLFFSSLSLRRHSIFLLKDKI